MAKIKFIIIFLASLFYLAIRLYQLPQLTTFHFDQGSHLQQAYDLVRDHKITLIGPPIISKSIDGRTFFIGPHYTYVLALLGVITRWDPLSITYILLLFESFSVFVFFYWLSRRFSLYSALLSILFLTTNDFFIIHSRFIWNPHFLLPLGLLTIFLLDRLVTTRRSKYLFFASFAWGLAFSFHFVALFWLPVFLVALKKAKMLFPSAIILLVPFGFFLGDLPYFIFEIRHHFYNLVTVIYVFTSFSGVGRLEPHYFLFPAIGHVLFFIGWLSFRLSKKNKLILFTILVLINFSYLALVKEPVPLGHPPGWSYATATKIVNQILADNCPKNYNIASTFDSNTRSDALRFLLSARNCPPQAVDSYPKNQTLFLLSPVDRRPETDPVWEVSSLRPFSISNVYPISSVFVLYRLDRQSSTTRH